MKIKYNICTVLYAGILFVSSLFTACSTLQVNVSSEPEECLILRGSRNEAYAKIPPWNVGVSPVSEKLFFMGKSDMYYYTAMKRGYYSDTIDINKENDPNIKLTLKRIPGTSDELYDTSGIHNAEFLLLPARANIYRHVGVGNLDSYKYSEELTMESTNWLNREMSSLTIDSSRSSVIKFDTEESEQAWDEVFMELHDYLVNLEAHKLQYYERAPSVKEILEKNTKVQETLSEYFSTIDNNAYLVFISCKSIKPTAGRAMGNAGVVVASGAVEGYNNAMYGDNNAYSAVMYSSPQSFNMDNNTLLTAYIIDKNTGEVASITQHRVPFHIANEDAVKEYAKMVCMFPDM